MYAMRSSQDPSSSPSRSLSSPRGSLRREGITAASQRTIAGSTFGRAAPSLHKASTQQATEERLISQTSQRSISSSHSRRPSKPAAEVFMRRQLFLPRNNWVPLGEGWYQVTVLGSGSTNRCGLHSVIEASPPNPFSCLYIPRSDGAYQACIGHNPEYDLEVSAKAVSSKPPQLSGISQFLAPSRANQSFLVIFAFKSHDDYCALRCDLLAKAWQLLRVHDDQEELLYQASDESLKINTFSAILLQIRGCHVSLDVNGQPIFTKLRVRSASSLSGVMGLLVEGTKIAIKGWKLKGLQTNISLNRSSISAVEECPPTPAAPPSAGRDDRSLASAPSTLTRRAMSVTSMSGSSPRPPHPPSPSSSARGSMSVTPNSTIKRAMSLSEALLTKRPAQPQSGRSTPMSNPEAHVEREADLDIPKPSATVEGVSRGVSDATYSQLISMNDPNLVDWVLQDVVQQDLGVTFDHIAALDTAKRLLHEAIVLPLVMPEFFTGIREPWKGVLLFGPPGTGKTMLAKAVCSLQNSTFFNCSASTLVSKYRGETEKIVRVLFQAARLCAPSVIFIDELDAIMGDRDKGQEHEASRRLKTELFAQIDGLGSGLDVGQRVVLLAASNCPWDLDPAMRRRLEKRIYIPLPDPTARSALLEILLRNIPISSDVDQELLVTLTQGYSGSDIQIICRDASMMPMRRLLDLFSAQDLVEMRKSGDLLVPKVTMTDFESALRNTRPSVTAATVQRYQRWEEEFSNK